MTTQPRQISKIDFVVAFKPAFTAAAGLICGVAQSFGTVMASAVTIAKVDCATFDTAVVLAIAAAGSATTFPTGTNAGLLMALIGPRYS